VPAWSIFLVMAQFEVVYIYAGLVKLNADWLRLEPLSMWLSNQSDFPVFGDFFMQDWSVAIAAYGVIILHMFGAPLLLFKKTRIYIFCIYACFHILNHFVFSIGIFPWLTLFATLIFFDPDWPKQVWNKLRAMVGKSPIFKKDPSQKHYWHPLYWQPTPKVQVFVMAAIGLWFAYQVLMPLRHFTYPGNVAWTEEGHRYAWQMKLRSKSGRATFLVKDTKTGRMWTINPGQYLTSRQVRKMVTHPDMILQFAHYLCDKWEQEYNIANVEVRVVSMVSLNGRKYTPMIDRTINLASIERSLSTSDWIIPLNEPLNRDPSKYRYSL
jgi:vitamin K-dependent gamma-carboxylase